MLSNYIFNDSISLFILLMFVIMIVIGVGVFFFLFKQLTKKSSSKVEELHESYDGIHEKNSPTPWGLHVVMICTILFSAWYVTMAFPLFHFDQQEQYRDEVAKYNESFNNKWKNMDEPTLLQMGESVFNTQCVICHGINGKGQNGKAANLVDFGNAAHIEYVIRNGSTGLRKLNPAMPPQFEILGENEAERTEAAKNVAAYVLTLSGKEPTPGSNLEKGKESYMMSCFACHGASGKGMGPSDDIPDFASDLTSYGTPMYIKEIISNGKNGYIGSMPSFKESGRLTDIQTEAVSHYLAKQLN